MAEHRQPVPLMAVQLLFAHPVSGSHQRPELSSMSVSFRRAGRLPKEANGERHG
jgi:hypothetical protein